MLGYWRVSDKHIQDLKVVVDYLKERADLPVWLIGTSLSSFSIANGGINLSSVNGLVSTSSVTKSAKKWKVSKTHPNGILDMELGKIKVPVLVVAHKNDGCEYTPASGAELIVAALKNSSNTKALYYSGGKNKDKPCRPYSYHGFYGIQKQVIQDISNFIKTN